MDKAAAAAELARLAEQAGKPELAKIALQLGEEKPAARASNATHGMWLDLSKLKLPEERLADSTDEIDALNSARTLQFGEEKPAARASNAAHGMWLDLSKLKLPEERLADSTDEIDALNSARTWQHYELEPSNISVQEAGGVDTVNLLPVTPGSSRTAKRRFRRQRVRQKLRLLDQFPQLTPRDLQCHQRLKLLEEW